MMLISIFYSENLQEAQYSIEKRIPYLVFPLVLGSIPKLDRAQLLDILRWTVLICIVSIGVDLALALSHYIETKNTDVFFWDNLAKEFAFHPSYLSIFILFCVTFLFIDFREFGSKNKVVFILKICFLSFTVVLLSSKLFVVLMFILLASFGIISVERRSSRIALLFVAAISLALTLQTHYVKERFNSIKSFHYKLDDPPATFNELTIRFALFDCSVDIISRSPYFGVGVGDTNDELDKTYRKFDYKFGYLDKQNPHNEYLSMLVTIGFVGFFFFIVSLFVPLYISIRQRNYLYTFLLVIFMTSFLVESTLERQKGIVLFYLFGSLLLFHPYCIIPLTKRRADVVAPVDSMF